MSKKSIVDLDIEKFKDLFENTDTHLAEIARQCDTTYKVLHRYIRKNYSEDFIKLRNKVSYRNSKLGVKNPSYGKVGSSAFHFINGKAADGKGYNLILKPDWFTGRDGSKYIFEHVAVVCEYLGLTELPESVVVHHIDKNKLNNNINNLAVMTASAHSRFHQRERNLALTLLNGVSCDSTKDSKK